MTKITRWNDRVSAIIWSGASLSSLNASRFHRRTRNYIICNHKHVMCSDGLVVATNPLWYVPSAEWSYSTRSWCKYTCDCSFSLCTVVLASAGLFIILQIFFGQRPLLGSRVHNACVPVCASLFMFDFFVCLCFPASVCYEFVYVLIGLLSLYSLDTALNAADKSVCAAISDQLEGRHFRCISSVYMQCSLCTAIYFGTIQCNAHFAQQYIITKF